ncbi:MAG: DHHA1 domain-containing protein [Acidobacteria bacterium]|nr:DHHA1 domain-containing protein [Acidobacteriota bacterium]
MTERLYYDDSYLTAFSARVVHAADPLRVYLDRTAFYPASGGQPNDTGLLNSSRVLDCIDEGGRIAHLLEAPLASDDVTGAIDWPRRFDHMQQHSGQHLLSALLASVYHIPTVSFHLGAVTSTIDVQSTALDSARLREIEDRVNAAVFENHPLGTSYQEAGGDESLRKPIDRPGTLRIVSIQDLDRSACGGTHVRSTAEIGPLFILKTEKIRSDLRVEFTCGLRALRRLREKSDWAFAQLATHSERLAIADKARRKAATELARYQGREAYQSAPRLLRGAPIDDETRAFAQSFTANPGAIFLQVTADPPSFLLAVSGDAGIDAGALTRTLVTAEGGRGGGTRQLAQGGLPDRAKLDRVLAILAAQFGLESDLVLTQSKQH